MKWLSVTQPNIPQFIDNVGIEEVPDVLAFIDIQAYGSGYASGLAPIPLLSSQRNVAFVHWVDASNFGVVLPHLPGGFGSESPIFEIYTDAPTGQSITVFLPNDLTAPKFTDGSTNTTIANDAGKSFTPLLSNTWGKSRP